MLASQADFKVYPFSKIISATNTFSTTLGQGATGEVFSGILDGIPIAVKRLKLSDAERIDVRQELNRRFHAELKALRKYAHPRVVRILGFSVDDDKKALHPFAIILELLEGGSLGDWLFGPNNEPPHRVHRERDGGAHHLSALERVDIALGSASGLAYLHGYRDVEDTGGRSATISPEEQVLHRDVKSANIGLALHGGGLLYAKLLDCGLAKALKGGDIASSNIENVSFTGGLIAGTVGYMAPELAQGRYTVKSEVYALGVVLLELLLGKRVGPRTATDAEEEAEEDGGVESIASRADNVWPKKVAILWASMALECIALREKKRLASVAVVIERLRDVKKLMLEVNEKGGEQQVFVPCVICLEECDEQTGAWCGGRGERGGGGGIVKHFCCSGCLQGHVVSVAEDAAKMRSSGGRVPCVSSGAGGCASLWNISDIGEKLEKATHVVFSQALVQALFDAPQRKKELEEARAAAEAATKEEGIRISEKVRRLRNVIVERDLTLHCPRCGQAFLDFQGCCALRCKESCGAAFCGLCLLDCGENAHNHFYTVHPGVNIYDVGAFEEARRARCRQNLIVAVKDVIAEKEVCKMLIEELGKADLDDLGMTTDDLFQELQISEQGGDEEGKGGAPLVLPQDAFRLVKLARLESVKNDAKEVKRIAEAIEKIASSDIGRQSCITAGAAAALVSLACEKQVKENSNAARSVALAIWNISFSNSGNRACVLSDASSALVSLSREKSVMMDGEVCRCVCGALWNIASSDIGRQSCIKAGAAVVLVALTRERAIKEYGDALESVTGALEKIAACASGVQSCIDALAPSALVELINEKVVKESASIACNIAGAIGKIAVSMSGSQALLNAGAPYVLISLAQEKIIIKNCDAVRNIAFAVSILSKSDAGNQAFISANAVYALIVLAREKTVITNSDATKCVAGALWTLAKSNAGKQACIDADAPSVLTALLSEKVVMESADAIESIAGAIEKISWSEDGRLACINSGAPYALAVLARQNVVKENSNTAKSVAFALWNIAKSDAGRRACLVAKAPSALASLACEDAVKENEDVSRVVAGALSNFTNNNVFVVGQSRSETTCNMT